MAPDPTIAAEPLAQAEQPRWIENPVFWSLFMRMVANAGGPPKVADLIRSLSDRSGISPKAIIAKMETHLFIGESKAMH
jgi:hypothetical protein